MKVSIRNGQPTHVVDDCHVAIKSAADLLAKKGAEWLLRDADIRFDTIDRPYYDTRSGRIVIAIKDDTTMLMSLLHELGHVLATRQSLMNKARIGWAHITAKPNWHPTDYSRQNDKEMMAELFRYYILDGLSPEQNVWMKRFVDEAKR